jgi:hypothetical protein
MVWINKQGGTIVTCSECAWWAPIHGDDVGWVGKEFEFHGCSDYPQATLAADDLDKAG